MEMKFDKILLTQDQIQEIIAKVAEKINKDYEGKEIVMVCMLKGATPFMMDLIKKVNVKMIIDFMQISSYHGGTTSSTVVFKKDIETNVAGKHVIIVDDIIDTAITMNEVMNLFATRKCASIEACCLLDKPSNRKIEFTPKYVGTTIPNEFVVGYGLDYDEYYRNLPFIGIVSPEVYTK